MAPSPSLVVAVLGAFLATAAAADDDLTPPVVAEPAGHAEPAPNPSCDARRFPVGGRCAPESAGRFCSSAQSCERYCCCAFSFDPTKWTGVYDWKTTNISAPEDIPDTIRPDSPDLVDLGTALRGSRVLVHYAGKVGTTALAAGLRRLDAVLAALPERATTPFTVDVSNCYRRAIGNELRPAASNGPDGNAEAVCGELFVMMRLEDKPHRSPGEDRLLNGLHSTRDSAFLMAWPGKTPHASGYACDLVLRDATGAPCFDATAGLPSSPTCAIDARHAVDLLARAVIQSGGARLDYEAWHYEWGGATGQGSCRCNTDGCDSIWPVSQAVGCPD